MKIYLEIFWYGVFFGWVPQRVYTHSGWILHTLDENFALNPVKTECKERRARDCAARERATREREIARFSDRSKSFFFVLFYAGSVAAVVLVWRKFFVDFFFLKISLFGWGSRRKPIVRLCFCCGSWGEGGRVGVKKRRWIGAMWRRRSLWMLSRKWSGRRRQGHCRNSFRSLPLRRLNPNGMLALNATFTSKSPSLLSSSSSSSSSSFVCVCVRACVVHLTLWKILLM